LKTHKDLQVWSQSINLVKNIYTITDKFPNSEIYGLTNQIRRAAVSIPSNIAEGAGRNSTKEFLQCLYISVGSLAELETQLILAVEIGYVKQIEGLFEEIVLIQKMLNGLIQSLKKR
jgi:four helix bundle protein